MSLGGKVLSLQTPDRWGRMAELVLGCDSLEDWIAGHPYFGALIGRYANRIAGGRFDLEGRTWRLPTQEGGHTLHGGRGFHQVLWEAEGVLDAQGAAVVLQYLSPHLEEGFPGNLGVRATYRVRSDNVLELDWEAHTDDPTHLNVTQHSYFNLKGAGDILDHRLTLPADHYLPVDPTLIPTGELRSVAGTPFDFRTAQTLGARLQDPDPQLGMARGYDHTFVVEGQGLRLLATVEEPVSGRWMEIRSTEPGLQLYTGNFLNDRGRAGAHHGPRSAFCLEPQHYPDTPNQPTFPSTVLCPGEVFRSRTEYRFGTE